MQVLVLQASVWLTNFAAALFHAMVNVCWQLFPVSGSFYDPAIFGILTLGFAIVLLAADRRIRESILQIA